VRIAVLLAVLALSAGALAQTPSTRTLVPLDPEEREFVLAEMRDFLGMIEKLAAALAQGDFGAVAAAAKGGGAMPPGIAKKLPPAFRAMARSTHEQIASIGSDAARQDLRHTLEQTSRLTATCNGCHAAYRFP
jgi:hypothetical protein